MRKNFADFRTNRKIDRRFNKNCQVVNQNKFVIKLVSACIESILNLQVKVT